ncbi:ComF family protein [Rathayibacter toxicus]|nr:ComF family protein [Rathayibacter toxicus]KKM47385.1 hypothetical protein VT73_00500 [Rathayibacter toxicus]QOD08811.1 ComF family protein [Rathayibacter toxicus]QOD10915.1 ComF family protein [Rathayibacter toxicus]QWL25607.1 ComF family protein [Rathayibacter toxicus]QWL27655.1 ComF family protein [Rathayibacter toxicus]
MVHDFLLDALAVVLPLECAACGVAASRSLCHACTTELAAQARMSRRVLGPPDDPLEVVTGAAYRGVVRRLVLALKEEGRLDATAPLAALLRPALAAARDGGRAILAGPPSSYARRVRRGFDPVTVLVRAAGGGRVMSPLRRVRVSRDQVGLGRRERSGNLDGAFRARSSFDATVELVLVDDVVTSGATLLELRRAIRKAGGRVHAAVVLAGTPLRTGDGSSGGVLTPLGDA